MAVLVIYYGKNVAVVVYVVKAEIIPSVFRDERVDYYAAVSLRTQTYQSCNHEVGKCRVVVVAAALAVAHEPSPVFLIEVFADVRTSAMVLAFDIQFHLFEECCVANYGCVIIVDVVRHGRERLACGERPYRAVPFTAAYAVASELRVAAFCRGETVWGGESFFVFHLLPSHVIFLFVRQVEIPWYITDGFTHSGSGVATHCFKERVFLVPQLVLYQSFQRIGLKVVLLSL